MQNHDSMTPEILAKSVEYIKNLARRSDEVLGVQLHGGEPFQYDIDAIANVVDELTAFPNISVSTTTNLVYELTPKHLEILGKMRYNGRAEINTSWDYKIRFKNDRQKTLWESNVRLLNSLGVHVIPIVSVSKLLMDDIDPVWLFEYFKTLGCQAFNVERLTVNGRLVDNMFLRPLNRELDSYLYKLYVINKKNYPDMSIPLFEDLINSFKGKHTSGCRAHKCSINTVTINPDGSVATCPNMSTKEHCIDTVRLAHIDEAKHKRIIKIESSVNSECYACEYYKFCKGECFQLQWDETGCPGLRMICKELLIP
jgi:radical SAM protein with 4Fe4S-binding SPASM domain